MAVRNGKKKGLFLSGMWGRVRACVPCSVHACAHLPASAIKVTLGKLCAS